MLSYENRAPRPQVTCTENFVKYGHVVFEICERTDKQIDRRTDVYTNARSSQYFARLPETK